MKLLPRKIGKFRLYVVVTIRRKFLFDSLISSLANVNSKERYISKDTESKIVHWQKVNLDFELIIIALLQEKFEDLSLIPKYSISTLYNNFQTD